MLSIKRVSSTRDMVTYYAALSEAEGIEYYSESGSKPGTWYGKACNALRIEGEVTGEVFKNLLEGRDPSGNRDLVKKRKNFVRRAGFDLTFSVPKSYSVAWSLAGDEKRQELGRIAEKALYKTLDEVQNLCGQSRRGYNGRTSEASNLLAAVFAHETSRNVVGEAPDANLHYHCVFPNLAERPDGTLGAIDSNVLFQPAMKKALGSMYRAELTRMLAEELGVRTYRPKKEGKDELDWKCEILGVSEKLMKAMSKRRREIERWLRKNGLIGARAAEKAALHTRRKKERFAWKELVEAWEELGKVHGVTREDIEVLFGQDIEQSDKAEEGRKASKRALERLLTHNARFTANELLLETAIEAQATGAGIDEIKEAVANLLEKENSLVRLQDKRGVPSYATTQMLEMEREVVQIALRLSKREEHQAPLEVTARVLRYYPTMRNEQREALRAIAHGGDAVSITGVAGAGKSFVIGAAREVMERSGYKILGTALSASTAKDLERETGITSLHIHKLLYQIDKGEMSLGKNTCLFVEEAGMVGTRHAYRIAKLASDAGAKLVMVGDSAQLQPVEAGNPYRTVVDAIGTTMLEEAVRQKEEWARDAALSIRYGKSEEGLMAMAERGRVLIEEEREDAIEKFVRDWCSLAFSEGGSPKETLAIAGQNVDVQELNYRIQEELKKSGQLGEYSVDVGGYDIHLGDMVAVTRNYPQCNLQNGARGEIVGVRDSRVWLKTEDGFEVELETKDFSAIALAYANTVYRSQGKTVEHALLFCDGVMTDREQSYVGATRAKNKTLIYTHKDAVAGLPELAELMNRSRPNELASDYVLEVS